MKIHNFLHIHQKEQKQNSTSSENSGPTSRRRVRTE